MAAAAAGNNKIKTMVVTVMENRSFDHMLGWMKSLNPEIDGVTGDETNHVVASDLSSRAVRFSDGAEYVSPDDPGHLITDIYEQVYGTPFVDAATTPITPPGPALMSGFAQQAEKEKAGTAGAVMSGFRPDDVPVYRELVREFAVCDRWFSSIPSETQPNRLYVNSATSHGLISPDTWPLVFGLPQRTIFDALHEQGLSFGIYFQNLPTTLVFRNLRRLKYLGCFHTFDQFRRHCREGKLPNYVFLEPRYLDLPGLGLPGNDDHPPHNVGLGQRYVKEVYEALRSSPQWEETLLVVTYDEHGGFYDHVPPPAAGVPSPDGVVSKAPFFFGFDRLGVRVPTLLVSPWIEPGTVLHGPPEGPSRPFPNSEYEHSSIPATVKKIFNLGSFLTKRDAWAGTFDCVLTRDTPRKDCPATLPEPAQRVKLHRKVGLAAAAAPHTATLPLAPEPEHAPLSDFQAELVQLAAVLKGEHTKTKDESYLHKLVEGMTVAEAARYCDDAVKAFRDESENCIKRGEDGSHIPTVN